MRWMADGLGTEAMAERGFIATNTVRNHVGHIMTKLDAHNRLEAVAAWRDVRQRPAEMILTYCRRVKIHLEPVQEQLIRAAFAAKRVECGEGDHVFAGASSACLCGHLKVAA